MAKKRRKKETPEERAAERARWQENHDRLLGVLERRLAQEGVTREEAIRRLRQAG
jgi:hypothetical protein